MLASTRQRCNKNPRADMPAAPMPGRCQPVDWLPVRSKLMWSSPGRGRPGSRSDRAVEQLPPGHLDTIARGGVLDPHSTAVRVRQTHPCLLSTAAACRAEGPPSRGRPPPIRPAFQPPLAKPTRLLDHPMLRLIGFAQVIPRVVYKIDQNARPARTTAGTVSVAPPGVHLQAAEYS